MDWIDYRKKLDIGFSDESKFNYFRTKMFNFMDIYKTQSSFEEYFKFCNITGTSIDARLLEIVPIPLPSLHSEIINIIQGNSQTICHFLAHYVAFINSREDAEQKKVYTELLTKMLCQSHIQYEIFEDSDGCFVFPKGAKELDDALVSEPLQWLADYPNSQKAFARALRDYANADENKASNVADNFRKALECFCQDFFEKQDSIEKFKSDIGKFLKNKDVPKEISNNFESSLKLYYSYINAYAKHRDATSDKLLEFIMYQTGNFIRLLITMKD